MPGGISIWVPLALLIFILPVLAAGIELGLHWIDLLFASTASLGIALCLIGLCAWISERVSRKWPVVAGLVLLSLLMAIHCSYLGLVLFSGRGFGPELFGHAGWDAVAVAITDYWHWLLIAALLVFGCVLMCWMGMRALGRRSRGFSLVLAFLGLVLVTLQHSHLPAWQLWVSWQNWQMSGEPPVLAPRQLEPWQELGLMNELPPYKTEIDSTPAPAPRNLILVYLESFNLGLLDHPDWPGLAPNLAELQSRFGWTAPVYSSAYVTIEGLANSQCGSLIPYFQGNDSLTSGYGLVQRLPCLADVLSEAGYRQVYMGGAKLGFAGKGEFLRAHGFDQVLGWQHWKQLGLEHEGSSWGLGDDALFDQATARLADLQHNQRPFNLTLLTIGTHIPGESYPECRPYQDGSEQFLNAIHCTDQLVGRWLETLVEQDLLRDTTLILTADHGVFENRDMRRLFGDVVVDNRIPFIVLGSDRPSDEQHTAGSAVNIPPTILDLLNIRTNASFLLGESMLGDEGNNRYFIARFRDTDADGRRYPNDIRACDQEMNLQSADLPLDSCEKQALLLALRAAAGHYSKVGQQLLCDLSLPLAASLGLDNHRISMTVSGLDQVARFTRKGASVEPGEPGLWALGFDLAGQLMVRRFYQPDELGLLADSLRSQPDSYWLVVLDIPESDDQLPPVFESLLSEYSTSLNGIGLINGQGEVIQHGHVAENGSRIEYELDETTCHQIFSTS